MEDYLVELYRVSNLVAEARQLVNFVRAGDTHHGIMKLNKIVSELNTLTAKCREEEYPDFENLFEAFRIVYDENTEWTVRADVLERAGIPALEQYAQSLGTIEQELNEEYTLESTATGFLTIRNRRSGLYLHSNNDPMDEARIQIEAIYDPVMEEYAVLGCGLGYFLYQLYLISRGSIKIHVFELYPDMISYASRYGVLDWIPEEVLEFHLMESVQTFLEFVEDKKIGVFMTFAEVYSIKDSAEHDAMMNAYGTWRTTYTHELDFQINFYRNIHSDAKWIRDLEKGAIKQEAVIIAAGPSLDDCLELLRSWQGKKTLIAVGTVFRKLLEQGIRPDFVVVMDPQKRTYKQIEGLEEETVPMIVDSAAYWEFAKRYKGIKYLTFTNSNPALIQFIKENKITPWAPGGTVTSLAVEVAAFHGAVTIYLAGVDLAYPGGLSHASGTMDYAKRDSFDGMLEVPGVLGKTVHTTYTFVSYLDWLGDFIESCPHIKWYNLSARGARIKGTVEIGEKEVIEEKLEAFPEGKISVVIPCYNVEQYLDKCVQSLLSQTLPKEMLEFIFVDDASTDSTWRILKKYAAENEGLVRIHRLKTNSRQGAARNAGIRLATGDCVGFVDADDYVEPEMFERLYRALKNTGSDVAVCGRYDELENGKIVYEGPLEGGILDMAKEAYANTAITEHAYSGIVQRLYRKTFLDKIKLWFPEKLFYEDNYFAGISNYYLRKVAMVPEPLYHYQVHEGSTMQRRNDGRILDRLQIEVMKVAELKRRGAYEYNETDIELEFLRQYFANTIRMLWAKYDELPKGIIPKMQETVEKLFPKWRENALLKEPKYWQVKKYCTLIDHKFKDESHEELESCLKELELI